MNIRFVAMLLCLHVGIVAADEYGPYICSTGCLLGGPTPDGQTQLFIQQIANQFDDTSYEIGDRIIVCNGQECATYRRAFMGFVLESREADDGGPYVNDSSGSGGGGARVYVGQQSGCGTGVMVPVWDVYRVSSPGFPDTYEYVDTGIRIYQQCA